MSEHLTKQQLAEIESRQWRVRSLAAADVDITALLGHVAKLESGPALPWVPLLTDLGVSDLVSELAEVLLGYYQGDHADDAAMLARFGEILTEHRDRARAEIVVAGEGVAPGGDV